MIYSSPRFEVATLSHPILVSPDRMLAEAAAQLLESPTERGILAGALEDSQPRPTPDEQRASKASCIVVQEQGQVVGIVTQRDLLRLMLQGEAWENRAIAQVMSHPVITLPLEDLADAKAAQKLFAQHDISHLPVVDPEGALLGTVTENCLSKLSYLHQNYELRVSQHRYAKIVAAAPMGIFCHDVSGDCTLINPRCLELLGLSSERIFDEQWQAALHPEDRDHVLAAWREAIETKQGFQVEYRFLHPDGQVKWIYSKATPEEDAAGEVIGFCGTLVDISDRKAAEAALADSDALIRSITDSVPGCIVYVDSSLRCQFLNKTYENWFNVSKDKLLGRHIKLCLGAKHYAQSKSQIEQALSGEIVACDTEITDAQGNHRYLSGTLVPDRDAQQQVRGYYALFTDITERKLAEQALQVSEARNRAILASIPDYLFCVDVQGRYREVLNYHPGITIFPQELNPVGRSMNDVLPTAVAERQINYLQQALSTGELQTFEQELPWGDGSRHEEVRVIQSDEDEVLFMVRDITERMRSEQQLQNLLAGTAAKTGQDFFPVLARHLAEALQVDHALVAELIGNEGELQSLAFWSNGGLHPAIRYQPNGTLCEFVLNDGRYQCEDLTAHFGDALPQLVAGLNAKSYLGIALLNGEGDAIGVLWVMNRYPLQNIRRVEDVMRVFAARAAAELERQRAILLLEQLNQELEDKVEERTLELRERKQFLQTVLDAFPLSIFWKDLDSVYLGCNRIFLRDAGLESTQEVIGKTDYDLVWGKTEAEIYRADDQAIIASNIEKTGIIEPLLQANGNRIWIETNKIPLRNSDGEVLGILGTYHDVTIRQEAEERLRQLSDRLDLAVSSAHIGIWEFDLEQDNLIWDQRMYELYNISPDQENLKFEDWYNCLYPDDRENVKEKFEAVCRCETQYDIEFRIVGPDDSIRFLKVNAVF